MIDLSRLFEDYMTPQIDMDTYWMKEVALGQAREALAAIGLDAEINSSFHEIMRAFTKRQVA